MLDSHRDDKIILTLRGFEAAMRNKLVMLNSGKVTSLAFLGVSWHDNDMHVTAGSS